jgi:hypothetical protein
VLRDVVCFVSLSFLRSLSFENCVVSNRSMIAIVKSCTILTTFEVNFGFYDELSYETVNFFAENCSKSLIILTWTGCQLLNSSHVLIISTRCADLQQLNIAGCEKVNFDVMHAFGLFSKNLRVLDMSSLESEVTSGQLNALFRGCCHLFWLNISCNKSRNCSWYRLPKFCLGSCGSLQDFIIKGFVVSRDLSKELKLFTAVKVWR